MSVKPLSPKDIEAENRVLPEFVFTTVNRLLREAFTSKNQKSATIKQETIIVALLTDAPDTPDNISDVTRSDIFDNHWLDFEDHYRDAGWKVKYDKPGYNETYEATFTFTKKYEDED